MEIGEFPIPDTVSAQHSHEICAEEMSNWPQKIKHQNKVLAKVYRPCQGHGSYRVTWYAGGARQMKSFANYSGKGGAKEFAEALVKNLARQSPAVMLTPPQATDALDAIARLQRFRETTGRSRSLLAAASEYCDHAATLNGQTLRERHHWLPAHRGYHAAARSDDGRRRIHERRRTSHQIDQQKTATTQSQIAARFLRRMRKGLQDLVGRNNRR